jgi:Leucine-rich repeat (LRR) protein
LRRVACAGWAGWAPTNDEIEVISSAVRENRLAWLDLSGNNLARISKPLCELSDLQWIALEGTQ